MANKAAQLAKKDCSIDLVNGSVGVSFVLASSSCNIYGKGYISRINYL